MAAVTTTRAPGSWAGPTTRPGRRVRHATYVRRRVATVVLGIAFVVVAAKAGAAPGGSALAALERRPAAASYTIVRASDSLWSVASRLAPGDDPRPIVDALGAARHGAAL